MTAATSNRGGVRRQRLRRAMTPWWLLSAPLVLLGLFFVAPLLTLFLIGFQHNSLFSVGGWTLSNFGTILHTSSYRHIAITTFEIATATMLVQLAVGLPLAYVLAFKAGRWELPLILLLVLADELNPIVRIYAYRVVLGREGIINRALETVGLVDRSHPLSWLLFDNFAVVVVLSTSYITYTVIPVYAAMKAIDPALIEAATDLGAGWLLRARRIVLPLAAPGIFIAIILVYIPLYTEFATPTLVGGTGSYMLGQLNAELITESGDLGQGAALSAVLLAASGVLAAVAYYLGRLNRLDA
jgi:ABC-type spermidine/putrescine transport system permease subunit I